MFEGCRLLAYLCPAGIWTIGWGSTGKGITKGVRWTQEEADARMESDATVYYLAAVKASPILITRNSAHCAVADFVYNLGMGRYNSSTFKKRIDEGEWEDAAHELLKWVHGGGKVLPGLVLRRKEEIRLILSGE